MNLIEENEFLRNHNKELLKLVHSSQNGWRKTLNQWKWWGDYWLVLSLLGYFGGLLLGIILF